MRKTLIAFSLIILSLHSCSEDKIKVFIEADNTKHFSEIEKKGIETKITELSDREAYREITKYLYDSWDQSAKFHLQFMGTDAEAEYKKIADGKYKNFEDAISVSKKLKGNQIYYKAESIKLNSKSDTAYFKVFYFDNNKNLIKEIYYK